MSHRRVAPDELAGALRTVEVRPGDPVALVVLAAGPPGRGPTAAVGLTAGLGVRPLLGTPPRSSPAARAGAVPPAGDVHCWITTADPRAVVAALQAVEDELRPRWVWWSARPTAIMLARHGLSPARCWDLAAAHRMLGGGRRDDPGAVWAAARSLPAPPAPTAAGRGGQLDLWSTSGPGEDDGSPFTAGGQLRGDWVADLMAGTAAGREQAVARAGRLAALALTVLDTQESALAGIGSGRPRSGSGGAGSGSGGAGSGSGGAGSGSGGAGPGSGGASGPATALPPITVLTARAESVVELLAVELERTGLPVDRATAVGIVSAAIGPRPTSEAAEAASRRRRDAPVLAQLPEPVDLRNPVLLREALRRVGIDVPDTRSHRLEPLSAAHPVVPALLAWRKAERMATTYGYRWLDTYVGADGRLRGRWQGSDGAGGRMTAQAGLHNLPGELRAAVAAEPGRLLVRADLGQIEPRVLAAVSGDPALRRATAADDLYAPVAAHLGCDRPTAKVAVLAAMYGQTSGTAGAALRQMRHAYPRALEFLDAADAAGRAGRPLRTYGGRLVRTSLPARHPAADAWTVPVAPAEPAGSAGRGDPAVPAAVEAARGRFARNAVIQGAAAELFKVWTVTVRAGLRTIGGEIVLCLHDELLLQVPADRAEAAAALLRGALDATAAYWAGGAGVRFVADVAVLRRWSEAKP